jgi:DNA polymerase III alpha subunit
MAKYMDARSGFTGGTADQLRRAVGIDEAGAGDLD